VDTVVGIHAAIAMEGWLLVSPPMMNLQKRYAEHQ